MKTDNTQHFSQSEGQRVHSFNEQVDRLENKINGYNSYILKTRKLQRDINLKREKKI